MKNFLASLWSKKLWILILGIVSVISGMAAGAIPIDEGINKIIQLIMVYLGVQGAVDITKTIKNNK